MPLNLTAAEARIIGCLLEKSAVTPEQYPLTLNALTNACNQKSGRNPVMALQQGEVQRTARALESQHLMRSEENFKSRAEKYTQRFCNSRFSDFQFEPAEYAIICLLLLRGPQTPGELRARSGRLHTFADNAAVIEAIKNLNQNESSPLVVELPRTPGRKDAEFMHLLSGEVDIEAHVAQAVTAMSHSSSRAPMSELVERIEALEAAVADLREQLGERA